MKIALLAMVALTLVADKALPRERIVCSERPASSKYWSWREIDGRRCWFEGHRSMPKEMLYWRAHDVERTPDRTVAVVAPPPLTAEQLLLMQGRQRWLDMFTEQVLPWAMNPQPVSEWKLP